MNSKKSLEQIKNHLLGILEIDAPELIHHYEIIFPIIEKDLERLEELEKVINNIFYAINQGLGMLPNNNFEFLKEVLENDK